MRNLILVLAGLIIASAANAGGWTGKVKIKGVFLLNDSDALVTLSSFNDPDKCAVNVSGNPDAGHIYFNPKTHPNWYSLILMAYATKKDVNVYVSGGCQELWAGSGYARVGHIRTYD